MWVFNPIATIPIAHGISDPHFALPINYSSGKSDYTILLSYSGISNWLYTLGFNSVFHVYKLSIICSLLAVISIPLAKVHSLYFEELLQWLRLNNYGCIYLRRISGVGLLHTLPTTDIKVHPIFIWPFHFFVAYFDLANLRFNFHTGTLIGFLSIAWCGHLVHVAIPISRGMGVSYTLCLSLHDIFSSKWVVLSSDIDKDNHIFSTSVGAGQAILTFLGGLKSRTISLYLTDIAHHHLGVAILFVWSRHLYLGLYKGFGHRIRHLFFVNGNSGPNMRSIGKSCALSLSLALGASCVITSQSAQHIYSLTPYSHLSYDSISRGTLYVHHSWIASFLMMATFAHAGIFLIRDYTIIIRPRHNVIHRILAHKGGILSHLSWICLWLGFHTFQVYIHNDSQLAFGEQEKQILIEPVFAQIIQAYTGKAFYSSQIFTIINPSSGWVVNTNNKSFDSFIIPVGPGDFLAHHAIAVGLHLTILILLKGSLDARFSSLMPDKIHFGYGFACDGPGRGGTCDISAWDSFYLATFWMLNTGAWITFYFHWKHLTLSQNTVFQFSESSTTMNGWFRDYLWFNSTPLIHAYNTFGGNDLSIWAWAFLGAHLAWATGFMFLISWRGYWQELISIILSMHERTPILYNLWIGDIYTPLALSILQARFVGLVHFSTGFILTYPPFIIGATT